MQFTMDENLLNNDAFFGTVIIHYQNYEIKSNYINMNTEFDIHFFPTFS